MAYKPRSVSFQAYRTSNQSLAANSESETVIFDTIIANNGGGYNPSTGVFTAPETGYYCFCSTLFFTPASGTSQYLIAYGGSIQSCRISQITIASAITSVSWGMPMVAGETVKIQPYADGSGTFQIIGASPSPSPFITASTFSGFKVD